jgi:hypothetical protein
MLSYSKHLYYSGSFGSSVGIVSVILRGTPNRYTGPRGLNQATEKIVPLQMRLEGSDEGG